MTDLNAMLDAFHEKYDPYPDGDPDWERSWWRNRYLKEEINEADTALLSSQRPAIAKEIADAIYVLIGTARLWRVDVDAALAEVHRSNMTKEVSYARGRKPIKGKDYSPADMSGACGATVVKVAK